MNNGSALVCGVEECRLEWYFVEAVKQIRVTRGRILVKCYLSTGYTETPEVIALGSCKGPATSFVFKNPPLGNGEQIEVLVKYPNSDFHMAHSKYQMRVIGTHTQTGKPVKGILVSPDGLKPFPDGTEFAIVLAHEDGNGILPEAAGDPAGVG